jgi:hypothetical protein
VFRVHCSTFSHEDSEHAFRVPEYSQLDFFSRGFVWISSVLVILYDNIPQTSFCSQDHSNGPMFHYLSLSTTEISHLTLQNDPKFPWNSDSFSFYPINFCGTHLAQTVWNPRKMKIWPTLSSEFPSLRVKSFCLIWQFSQVNSSTSSWWDSSVAITGLPDLACHTNLLSPPFLLKVLCTLSTCA